MGVFVLWILWQEHRVYLGVFWDSFLLVLLPLFTAGQNDPRATGKCPSRQSATACYHLQLTVFWVNSSKCKWNQTLHIFSDADGYTQVPSCTVCHFKSQTSRKKGCAAFLVKTEVTGNMNHSAVLSSWKGSISIRYTLKTQSFKVYLKDCVF